MDHRSSSVDSSNRQNELLLFAVGILLVAANWKKIEGKIFRWWVETGSPALHAFLYYLFIASLTGLGLWLSWLLLRRAYDYLKSKYLDFKKDFSELKTNVDSLMKAQREIAHDLHRMDLSHEALVAHVKRQELIKISEAAPSPKVDTIETQIKSC